ncbi:MAG: ABC transporter ATP-binding protein [Bacillota bacterium]|nr:ABC transporter ATP-binding protein [Bacillota bacterium]
MILCEGLTRSLDRNGIFDISFQVEKGQALALLGPADAGKSVLLRVLAGQVRQDAGKATILGMDCWSMRQKIFEKTVYLPASPCLEPKMTGEEYLRFTKDFFGDFNPQKARDLTEKMDIALTGQCGRMSPEARKKLSLLAALSQDKDVFLLDEPFSGLGPNARNALYDVLQDMRERGAAILMTSHVLDEARKACSHVSIIRKGRQVVTQAVEALSITRQKVYHITFSSPAEAADFAAEWEAGVELIGARAMVAIPSSPKTLLSTLARYDVVDFIGGREETEEGFLRYYGDDIV